MKKTWSILVTLLLCLTLLAGCAAPESAEKAEKKNETAEKTSEEAKEAAEKSSEKSTEASEQSSDQPKEVTEKSSDDAKEATEKEQTIKVGASVTPHAEILQACVEPLKKQGIKLEIVEFTDYVLPNEACQSGDIDANYFQHVPYLENYNKEKQADLVSLGKVHYEPMGLYGGRLKSIDDLKEGASIGLPNDSSNQARALLILQKLGWIDFAGEAGLSTTLLDIKENPHKLKFQELAAEQLPRSLEDLDYAVINGNVALSAGLSVSKDALYIESADSEAAQTFANVIAAKKENAEKPALKALMDVLHSKEIADFIEQKYDGAVVPIS